MKKLPLLLRNKEFIIFLNSLPFIKKKKILATLSKKHLDSISEIFANFLKKHLPIAGKAVKRLAKFKKEARQIALKKTSHKKKINILKSSKGGFLLSVLLPAAVTLISSLLRQ